VARSAFWLFSADERKAIGVHVCPGGDRDSTHSADVDYAKLLPDLFQMEAGRFYLQMASEGDRPRVLRMIREVAKPEQFVFVGVIDPITTKVEPPQQVRDRVLEAAEFLSVERLVRRTTAGLHRLRMTRRRRVIRRLQR
jgi:5-methyltetrahydropteroyltriglutamate--homocysteine methyltransferase